MPLVSAWLNSPFSYNKDIDRPSIFGSHTNSMSSQLMFKYLRVLSMKSSISLMLKPLFNDNIGLLCLILVNFSNGSKPISSLFLNPKFGFLTTKLSYSTQILSNSLSDITGSSWP